MRTSSAAPREPVPQPVSPGERPWLREVIIVTIVAAVAVLAAAMARPMVTYRALDLGASPFEIGVVQAAYSFLPMLTAVAMGRWVDRVGEPRVMALGCAMLVLGAAGLAIADTLAMLTAGQVVMGFGVIATAIATQSAVASRGAAERAVHRFGWFSVAIATGQIVGPALAAFLVDTPGRTVGADPGAREGSIAITFVASAIVASVALVLIRLVPGRTAGSGPEAEPAGDLLAATDRMLRSPGIAAAMFVSLAVASGLDVLIVYLPAFGEATGLSVATVGALLAVRAGATVVSRAFMGRMTDRLGPGRALVLTTGLAAACVGLLAVPAPLPVLFVLIALLGFGLGIGQPLTVAWIGLQSPPNERGLAFGIRHTGNLATLVVVPIVMGVIAGATGIGAVWLVMAAFLAGATVIAARTRFSGARLVVS
jgi:MFS family permease